jgi:hypothetical protein
MSASRFIKLFSLASMTLCMVPVGAKTPPPEPPTHVGYKGGTLNSPDMGASMGAMHIQFEKTRLRDIWETTLTGEVSHQGDAGDSESWLCFTARQSQQTERIWIVSDGEMGGTDQVVTALVAETIPKGAATKDCPMLPSKFTPIVFDNGVWLGQSSNELNRLLSGDILNRQSWGLWNFEGKRARSLAQAQRFRRDPARDRRNRSRRVTLV